MIEASKIIPPTNTKRNHNFRDLTGLRFGRLLVISELKPVTSGPIKWNCQCDCGNKKVILGASLRDGLTESCGCLQRELFAQRRTIHGQSIPHKQTSEYWAWQSMKRRCLNPKNRYYCNYGGRGIKVCDRWIHSFENFFADVGPKPSPKHTIDRKNNDGNYEPGNVRWATRLEQMANTRRSRMITHGGKTLSLSQWSRELGIPCSRLAFRLKRDIAFADAIS